ncbi:hypothetical protein PIB30_044539 [Stylosanthes scabra]|uniref:Uncharacterized protein n=1 Tax=Stylosanthes scabra TaxID=79078 RepID=A0ABU6TG74_9FABA|nr:hypothetical protein [Stylosanthes scabra]
MFGYNNSQRQQRKRTRLRLGDGGRRNLGDGGRLLGGGDWQRLGNGRDQRKLGDGGRRRLGDCDWRKLGDCDWLSTEAQRRGKAEPNPETTGAKRRNEAGVAVGGDWVRFELRRVEDRGLEAQSSRLTAPF